VSVESGAAPVLITILPSGDFDDPLIWRADDSGWQEVSLLSEYPGNHDLPVMAIVRQEDVRCAWTSLPDLEARQAESVARLQLGEQSLGAVHIAGSHIGEAVISAAIAPERMEYGLGRLLAKGISPDIVIPLGLAVPPDPEAVLHVSFADAAALRGVDFAIPDEPVFQTMLVGSGPLREVGRQELEAALYAASQSPLLNLRSGAFAKRTRTVFATAQQKMWIKRLLVGLVAVTVLLGIVTWTKYRSATSAENERALAAAQRIDPSIKDIAQAETLLVRAVQQKGVGTGDLGPLSAGLWKAVKASPNVTLRELRYGNDGILLAVMAAPNADAINRALIAIQQDGFRVTATPRQDSSGATLVDFSMRMQ
jgi:general secretion pathway protein L